MKDPSEHTHLQLDYYLSLTGHERWKGEQESWLAGNYDIYMLLRPDADPDRLGTQITSTIKNKYRIPAMQQNGEPGATTVLKNLVIMLQPVSDIHLAADIQDSMAHVDRKYLWLFGAIGFLYCCWPASILSTYRRRAAPIGQRKWACER